MKRLMTMGAMMALGAWATGAMAALPYGTYLVQGAFKDSYNVVLRDTTASKVRLQRADGSVIAESSVRSASADGNNFILEVPVATASTPKSCAVGETLDCTLVSADETLTVPACLKVGSPTTTGNLVVNCTATKSYVNPKDGTTVEVPVAYIQEVELYLPEGASYDPWADYDNDGVSNYAEYLAGTIPFDESDRLRVISFGSKNGQFALKYESVGGHVYAVSSANTLAKPEWAKRNVRKDPDGQEQEQVLADDADGQPGTTEIYITPLGSAKSEFFMLEAK